MMIHIRLCLLLCILCAVSISRADDGTKPRAAVFPLAGTAAQDDRDKVGFSLRAKLDRDGHFEPIDGPTMAELAGDKPIDLSARPNDLAAMAKDESPVILIWGELNARGSAFDLKVKVRDLRQKDGTSTEIDKQINQPTDMRFVVEEILKTIKGVSDFSHPIEESVINDPASVDAWKKNPNLVVNGDFAKEESWRALLRKEVYQPKFSEDPPAKDKVVIYKLTEKGKTRNVLAMNLSKDVAESNGLACISEGIDITRDRRYRLQFKYKSDGPSLHVFVKGYVHGKDISGGDADVESYRCQVPPSGATHGKWETVVCDVNPQNVSGNPTFLKIDLYAYLSAGTVMFDDVQLKEVGDLTRHAADDAIKPPAQ